MKARTPLWALAVAAVVVTLIISSRSLFVVRVDQFAIVTEFGKPVKEVNDPGLYFLIPFVQETKYLDKRIRGWDDRQEGTKTADSRQIDYTVYARWQVANALVFYKAVGDEKSAHAVMDSIVTGRIQSTIRANKLSAILRETGRAFVARASVDARNIFDVYQECNPDVNPEFRKTLSDDPRHRKMGGTSELLALRSTLVDRILDEANKELIDGYGIVLRDVHFKYLNYSQHVHADIIKQIEADRRDDISSYLEIGRKCVGYINRITDAERGRIVGSGERRVREINGDATAKAIQIKAQAFAAAPEFYLFLQNLDLYEEAFRSDTRLILATDSPMLELLEDRTAFEPLAARDQPRREPAEPPVEAPEPPVKVPEPPAPAPIAPTDAKPAAPELVPTPAAEAP